MVNATLTPSQSPSRSGDEYLNSQSSTSAPPTGVVETLMHKNDLQTYCQRLGMPLPAYQTEVQGYAHAPRFKASVCVGKSIFTSQNTFSNRKPAEQDVAKIALECLLKEDEANATNLRVHLRQLIIQDKTHCKMIMDDFLGKLKIKYVYETVQVDGMPPGPPLFASSLVVNGFHYKGSASKSKKEAEKRAARIAILSFLDDPTHGALISKVIKSKCNENHGDPGVLFDNQGGAGHPSEAVGFPRCSCAHLPRTSPPFSGPQQPGINFRAAAQTGSQQISVPRWTVPPAAQNLAYDTISSKRIRENENKEPNKRFRAEDKHSGCSYSRSEW
ncbi:unnamed protein product [Microthlaspi erraticum]|uniref:DRBM domain-containing protein n=1 Tax=Microthlaspi erraticum TaxID=1685480 RepID=A0A6D2IAA0_9BRAS|nr:unnamed protein product [Microthlaspi erraticum]